MPYEVTVSPGDAVFPETLFSPAPLQDAEMEISVSAGDLLLSGPGALYDPEAVTEIQVLTQAVESQTAFMQTGLTAVLMFLGLTAGIAAALGLWIGARV